MTVRYRIHLHIGYGYRGTVKDARHVLRVTPREDAGQRAESVRIDIAPRPAEIETEPDFFGNATDHLLIREPHAALAVDARLVVAVDRPAPDLAATPDLSTLRSAAAASCESEGDGPIHFLGAGRLVEPAPAVGRYLAQALDAARPAGETMLEISRRIRTEFRFAPGVSTVSTRVEETFERRAGVCQDFAHLLIAGLRALDIPARYASGFLRTLPPPGKPRLAGADAMHAWVEVWLGEKAGWIGFDPTNACLALEDHVLVAVGRDYADVAPIDGVLMTSGPQRTRHSVDMVALEETVAA
jgi:transglutaminase-like putative cysteine protease